MAGLILPYNGLVRGGAKPPPIVTWRTNFNVGSTTQSIDVGSSNDGKMAIVARGEGSSPDPAPTVGGITTTLRVSLTVSSNLTLQIFTADISSLSGSQTVDYNGVLLPTGFWYADDCADPGAITDFGGTTANATSVSTTLDVDARGAVLAYAGSTTRGADGFSAGVTLDSLNTDSTGDSYAMGHDENLAAETGRTVTSTRTFGSQCGVVAISIR